MDFTARDRVIVEIMEKTAKRNVNVSIVVLVTLLQVNATAHQVGTVKNAKKSAKSGFSVKTARSNAYVRKITLWHAIIKQENASVKLKVEEVKR